MKATKYFITQAKEYEGMLTKVTIMNDDMSRCIELSADEAKQLKNFLNRGTFEHLVTDTVLEQGENNYIIMGKIPEFIGDKNVSR